MIVASLSGDPCRASLEDGFNSFGCEHSYLASGIRGRSIKQLAYIYGPMVAAPRSLHSLRDLHRYVGCVGDSHLKIHTLIILLYILGRQRGC